MDVMMQRKVGELEHLWLLLVLDMLGLLRVVLLVLGGWLGGPACVLRRRLLGRAILLPLHCRWRGRLRPMVARLLRQQLRRKEARVSTSFPSTSSCCASETRQETCTWRDHYRQMQHMIQANASRCSLAVKVM